MTHEQEMALAYLCRRIREDAARGVTKGKIQMHPNMRAAVLAAADAPGRAQREIEAQRRQIAELRARLNAS